MNKQKASGTWTAIGTFLLVGLCAYQMNAFPTVLQELSLLLSGSVKAIPTGHTLFLNMIPYILAAVTLGIPTAILSNVLVQVLLGESGKHAVSDMLKKMTEGNHFMTMFLVVAIEEVFARGLCLGVGTKIAFLSGPVGFYLLFLIGNSIWSIIHLSNFAEEKDRNPLRTIPQFIGGIFFTYIFVKFGLLASVLTHFAYNAIVMCMHKVQRVNIIDALLAMYAIICMVVSYSLMSKPISDINLWFADQPTFALPGWGFWDYLYLSIFVSGCLQLVFEILCYDKGHAGKNTTKDMSMGYMLLGIAIILGLTFGLFTLFGAFTANVPYRILLTAIVLSFIQKGASGSAMARTFWSGLPNSYIAVCIFHALGFWLGGAYVLAELIISWPQLALNKLDD